MALEEIGDVMKPMRDTHTEREAQHRREAWQKKEIISQSPKQLHIYMTPYSLNNVS